MIIACATDERYAELAGVLMRSLAVNGDAGDARVVLIGDDLGAETVAALKLCAEGLNFHYISLGDAAQHIASLPRSFYSRAIHIKLLLPDIIRESGRILYLDSDILINRSIRALSQIELGPYLLAAAEDAPTVLDITNARLGRPAGIDYFNSGVLLFDLDQWRRHDISRQCLNLVENRNDYWPDQDAINIVLEGKIQKLDRIWNCFSLQELPREEFLKAHVIHFIPDKPVSANCPHPMFPEYLALRSQTPWHDRPLNDTLARNRISLFNKLVAQRVKQHKLRQSEQK